MSQINDFAAIIRRIRAGDQAAAATLVAAYEPEIRLEVRIWLRRRHAGLRRAFDSVDICQAVLGSFFLRVAAGQYVLETPEQLIRLLVTMARNKLAEEVKCQQRHRRDIRRVQSLGPQHEELTAIGVSPSDLIAGNELLFEFRKRLSVQERQIADMRGCGDEWSAIAAKLGGTSEGCRKHLSRAIKRIVSELGLEGLGWACC